MTSSSGPTICLECIGDAVLHEQLRSSASEIRCTYCKRHGPGVSLEQLAAHADSPLRSVLRQGSVSPHFTIDSDSAHWEQDGDDLVLYIQELLEIEYDPAEALIDELIEQDPADPRDGEDPFYARDQLYQLAETTNREFTTAWVEFEQTLKHDQRFFGFASAYLARLLGEAGSTEAAELPVYSLALESGGRVFRARRAESADEARAFLNKPAEKLSGPPPAKATAGRMNPAGISVFYGALSAETAIAEVRPPVGGILAVASFLPSHALRMLDLTSLHMLPPAGSIFDPLHQERVARRQFLRGFHSLVVQPVQPHEEPLEYLPTQAIAEYVRNVLRFDGIRFASTQVGALTDIDPSDEDEPELPPERCNVVVFARPAPKQGSVLDDPPVVARIIADFPLHYEEHSAYGVWVRKVAYTTRRINLDDERGPLSDESEVAEIKQAILDDLF